MTCCSLVLSGSGTRVNKTRKRSRCSFAWWTCMLLQKLDAGSSPMLWGTWVDLWRRSPWSGVQHNVFWKKPEEGWSLGSGLGNISTCLAVTFLHSHLLLATVKTVGAGWTFCCALHGFACAFSIEDLFCSLVQLQKPFADRIARVR